MKKWWVRFGVLFIIVLFPPAARAQSLADAITQLTLDYEKLSELKKILQDMYKAYTIVSTGYENIRSIAEGNFNLHEVFLDGLLLVSPTVADYYKIRRIIENEAAIVSEYKAASRYFNGMGRFSADELDYFNRLYGNLLNGSLRNLSELTMVITAGQMRMSDAERLATIDRIDRDIGDKLNFLRSFNNSVVIQAGQRGIDANNLNAIRSLYGIGN
jgi:hypothetical protein